MNKSYSSKYEVASDIVKHWQNFAVASLFDVMSFNSDFEVDTFQLAVETNVNMRVSRDGNRINVVINVYEYNHEAYQAALALRNVERRANRRRPLFGGGDGNNGYEQVEIVNCYLKDLRKHINKENAKHFIQLAELFLNNYNENLLQKEHVTNLVNATKSISKQLISKEFLVEKM